MRRAIIITNGDLTEVGQVKKLVSAQDLVVAVDGGLALAKKLKLVPSVVVGDLDSIRSQPKLPLVKYPTDKDFTDTELAIDYALKHGAKEIILIGFLGRRLDHLVTNLLVLARLVKKNIKVRIIEGDQTIWLIKDKLAIQAKKGDLVSLVPLLGDCHGVVTTGLKYRLQGWTLKVGYGRGVSNVMLKSLAKIELKKGLLMVVQQIQ